MSEKEMANITAEANEARLSTLAAEINTIKTQTQKIMMQAAVEIGRRLVEAKGAVGHGGWGLWLERNVDYSERTAQNLIRIFQEYGEGQQSLFGESNPQAFADLTYTQAVALLGIKNPDERAEFVETHDVANMTSRDLADAIKERDEARAESENRQKNIDALQKTLEDKSRAAEKEKEGFQKTLSKYERETAALMAKLNAAERELREAQETAGGATDEGTKKRIEEMEKAKAELEAKLKKAEKERDEAAKQRKEMADAEIELMKERDDLRAQVARLVKESAKEQNADPGKAAFSAYFNLAKNAFNGMLEAVGKIEDDQEKYRAAMVKMLEAMVATVKESTDE